MELQGKNVSSFGRRLAGRPARALDPLDVLLQRHAGYRNRVRMGANWCADVWTVLEHAPEISPAEAARRAGCSFATAWHVVQDFALLRAARNASTSSSG